MVRRKHKLEIRIYNASPLIFKIALLSNIMFMINIYLWNFTFVQYRPFVLCLGSIITKDVWTCVKHCHCSLNTSSPQFVPSNIWHNLHRCRHTHTQSHTPTPTHTHTFVGTVARGARKIARNFRSKTTYKTFAPTNSFSPSVCVRVRVHVPLVRPGMEKKRWAGPVRPTKTPNFKFVNLLNWT